MTGWIWALIGLAAFFVLIILILSIPVHAVVHFDSQAERKIKANIRWLFGILNVDVSKRRWRRRKPKKKRRGYDWRRSLVLLQTRGLFATGWRTVRDVLHCIRIKDASVYLRFSTGDFFTEGIVMGMISAVQPCLMLPPRCDINIKPVFDIEQSFKGHARLDISIVPLRLTVPAIRFLISRPIRKMGMSRIRRPFAKRSMAGI